MWRIEHFWVQWSITGKILEHSGSSLASVHACILTYVAILGINYKFTQKIIYFRYNRFNYRRLHGYSSDVINTIKNIPNNRSVANQQPIDYATGTIS